MSFVVLCDMDGVVWLAHHPLPGAVEAIDRLRSNGHRVVFVTNNSYATVEEQEALLGRIGVPAVGDVVTSAMASAFLVEPGSKVLICGGRGLTDAVERRGASPVQMDEYPTHEGAIDAVVVGFHRHFDYESLTHAAHALRSGARFIASNEDATYPTPSGPIPGGGSIVAAVAKAAGMRPIVAGKPHPTMAEVVRFLVPHIGPSTVMIGDRLSTDGAFARTLGCRFALVQSQITQEEVPVPSHDVDGRSTVDSETLNEDIRVDVEGGSLEEVVSVLLGASGRESA